MVTQAKAIAVTKLEERMGNRSSQAPAEQSEDSDEYEDVYEPEPSPPLLPGQVEVQAAKFRLVRRRVQRNSTSRPDEDTHRNEAGPLPAQQNTWLWNLLTGAWGLFFQPRITAGNERQRESRITGAQMVVDDQEDFED